MDLSLSYASIDWVESNLAAFEERMQVWLNSNVGLRIDELESDISHNLLVAFERAQIPLAFSVELGAYINVIRSSLDILATTIALHHKMPKIDRVQFPVAQNACEFHARNFRGAYFIENLPIAERKKIESFMPYHEGKGLLWELHALDRARKHRRLLAVETRPSNIKGYGWGSTIKGPNTIDKLNYRNGETELGLVSKAVFKEEFRITAQITIAEPGHLHGRNAIGAIRYLTNMAMDIIRAYN